MDREKDEVSNRAEQYIINESQEISLGESIFLEKFFSAFPAFKSRDYQLYFVGQGISLTGTWIQTVAQSWLVLELTHSAFWVGTVAALSNLPTLFFSLFAGVIIDRYSRKKIQYITQTVSLVLAAIMGLLTIYHLINLYQICVFTILFGIVGALDIPARQAFAVDMVGKEKLSSAIALNSGLFNAARVVGPAIAGILIAQVGVGGSFLINALSFLFVILALYYIKARSLIEKDHPHPLESIKEGLSYSFSHQYIKMLLIFSSVCAVFSWSYVAMMPVIAQDVFHQGAAGLGYLYAASGLGAVIGSLVVSMYSKKIKAKYLIHGGNFLFVATIILFTLTHSVFIAYFFLFFSGLGLVMQFSMMNAEIQHQVDDRIRGRVMSIYILMFVGMLPLGSFLSGIASEHFGPQVAISLGALVSLFFGIYVFIAERKILRA